jgi:hypothetical protein
MPMLRAVAVPQTPPFAAPGATRTQTQCFDALRQADWSMPQLNGMAEGVGRSILAIGRVRPLACPSHEELLDTLRHWTQCVEKCERGTNRAPIAPSVTTPSSAHELGELRAVQVADEAAHDSSEADPERARTRATNVQYALERWIAGRLQAPALDSNPLVATAIFHTPRPCTPLLVEPGRPVPAELISPAYRGAPSVVESVARRVVSVRDMADCGAKVVVCYPKGERDNLPLSQSVAYTHALKSENITDFPARPGGAFKALSGATYIVGSRESPFNACVAFRLVQARNIGEGAAAALSLPEFGLATQGGAAFNERLNELRDAFDFRIETLHG